MSAPATTVEIPEQDQPQPQAVPSPRLASAQRLIASRSTRGMTLIEILVVLAIIGLIMGGVAIVAFQAFDDAKLKAAANDMATLSNGVEMYRLQKNKCPKSAQDLKAAGIIKQATKDPWGQDYVIKCPGEHGSVDITSPGKDGQLGTEDDINSWDEKLSSNEPEES